MKAMFRRQYRTLGIVFMMLAKYTGHSQGQVVILGPAFSSQSTNYKAAARPHCCKVTQPAAKEETQQQYCQYFAEAREGQCFTGMLYIQTYVYTLARCLFSPLVCCMLLCTYTPLFSDGKPWGNTIGTSCLDMREIVSLAHILPFQGVTHKFRFQTKKQRGLRHRELIQTPVLVVSRLLMPISDTAKTCFCHFLQEKQ